jgi:hypothetical protein
MPTRTQSEEYDHLLASQRLLFKDIQQADTASVRANSVKVLVAVVQLKREMRMVPKPKPVDVSQSRKSRQSPVQPQE